MTPTKIVAFILLVAFIFAFMKNGTLVLGNAVGANAGPFLNTGYNGLVP